MPYVQIQVTREGVTKSQKQKLIEGTTDLLVKVLGKDPKTTHIVITETDTDNWGVAGKQVTELRKLAKKGKQ